MKKYLVQRVIDGECSAKVSKANNIILYIDMQDCSGEQIRVYDVSQFGHIEELQVHGTWHDPKNPLYIKVCHSDGTIAFDGYGSDH